MIRTLMIAGAVIGCRMAKAAKQKNEKRGIGDGLTFEERYKPGEPYNNTMNLKHDAPIKRKT